MTTKKVSCIKLPKPKYSLELGYLDVHDSNNIPGWIPRFSNLAQIIEVRHTGRPGTNLEDELIYPFILIHNCLPELFVRRDFISKFVHTGEVYLVNDSKCYQMHTKNNKMILTMSQKQYQRFGLIGKRLPTQSSGESIYRVELDLQDERIINSNKFQYKLIVSLRRLEPSKRVYFRYIPNSNMNTTTNSNTSTNNNAYISDDNDQHHQKAANELSMEFFKYVIKEYQIDGYQPIPLTDCSLISQNIERRWQNYYQSHPNLDLRFIEKNFNKILREPESMNKLINIIDWLGFQLLSLKCEGYNYNNAQETRYDVSCSQIRGIIDRDHLGSKLTSIFKEDNSENGIILRALILYESEYQQTSGTNHNIDSFEHDDKSGCVYLLQDCKSNSNLILTVAMN